MTRKIWREVKKEFQLGMGKIAPEFSIVTDKSELQNQQDVIYRFCVRPDLKLYIGLLKHHMYNWFFVEVAIAKHLDWRDLYLDMSPDGSEELRFRATDLWVPASKDDGYWVGKNLREMDVLDSINLIQEDAELLEQVPVVVSKCLQDIKDYVLPYFEKKANVSLWPVSKI